MDRQRKLKLPSLLKCIVLWKKGDYSLIKPFPKTENSRYTLNEGELNDLLTVAEKGNNLRVKCLVLQEKANIHQQNKDGEDALMLAAKHGREKVVNFLLSAGADVFAKNKNGQTAYELAINQARIANIIALHQRNRLRRRNALNKNCLGPDDASFDTAVRQNLVIAKFDIGREDATEVYRENTIMRGESDDRPELSSSQTKHINYQDTKHKQATLLASKIVITKTCRRSHKKVVLCKSQTVRALQDHHRKKSTQRRYVLHAAYNKDIVPFEQTDDIVLLKHINGTVPFQHNDGKIPFHSTDDAVSFQYTENTVPPQHTDSTVRSQYIDGTVPFEPFNNGTAPFQHTDGIVPFRLNDGKVPLQLIDGTFPFPFTDGTDLFQPNDGTVPLQHNEGTVPLQHNDGTVVIQLTDSTVLLQRNDSTVPLQTFHDAVVETPKSVQQETTPTSASNAAMNVNQVYTHFIPKKIANVSLPDGIVKVQTQSKASQTESVATNTYVTYIQVTYNVNGKNVAFDGSSIINNQEDIKAVQSRQSLESIE